MSAVSCQLSAVSSMFYVYALCLLCSMFYVFYAAMHIARDSRIRNIALLPIYCNACRKVCIHHARTHTCT